MFWTRSPLEIAAEFGGFVLAHSALISSLLGDGELICPYAVIEAQGQRQSVEYEEESQVEAIEQGKADFEKYKDTADIWAFAREGLFSDPGSPDKTDVILISSWAPGMTEWLGIIQRFNPASSGNFRLIGDPMIYVEGNEAVGKQATKLAAAVGRGIKNRGTAWDSWKAHDA